MALLAILSSIIQIGNCSTSTDRITVELLSVICMRKRISCLSCQPSTILTSKWQAQYGASIESERQQCRWQGRRRSQVQSQNTDHVKRFTFRFYSTSEIIQKT